MKYKCLESLKTADQGKLVSAFITDAEGKFDVLWRDGNTHSVDSAQVGVVQSHNDETKTAQRTKTQYA